MKKEKHSNGNKSPLFEAVEEIVKQDYSRFHTPGHKGLEQPLSSLSHAWDITEIPGADSLYEATGAIGESEKRFAQVYGAGASLLSAGGSTLCIQTMIALATEKKKKLMVARGVHTSAVNAMALLDIQPIWAYGEWQLETGLMSPPTPKEIETLLQKHSDIGGVYLTSPNYYGQNADIKGIAEICNRYHVPVLVDAAHGAHYPFLDTQKPLFPLAQGAAYCCNSLHKTLPSMTGAAILHLQREEEYDNAKKWMSIFGSTSPSYPILLSADRLLPYLEMGEVREDFVQVVEKVKMIQDLAKRHSVTVPQGDFDPARITLGYGAVCDSQERFLERLHQFKIEPEYLDDSYVVLLPGAKQPNRDWERLENFCNSFPAGQPLLSFSKREPLRLVTKCSLKEALFASSHSIPIEKAEGHIATVTVAPCPPGIPLVLPGEQITQEAIIILKRYRISHINVL